MRKIMLLLAVLGALVFTSACDTTVSDADLSHKAALTDIQFQASTDDISKRVVHISGNITLGYTSSKMVDVKILDNETTVFATSLSADKLAISFEKDIVLLHEDENNLSVFVSYNDQYIKQNLVVNMPISVKSFTLKAAKATVDRFSADLTGKIVFGYLSSNPATFSILVNGKEVYAENIDVSKKLEYDIAQTVQLMEEGKNSIVGKIVYGDTVLTKQFAVKVNTSISEFTLTPAKTTVDTFSVDLSGTAVFGFLSDDPAVLTISVNGKKIYADNIDVSKELSHDLAITLPLTDEGINKVVATLSYGKNTLTQQFTVTIAGSILSFTLTPAKTAVDTFSVDLSGTAVFGFVSADPAVLTISVNGKKVYADNIDVSKDLSHDIAIALPLTDEGANKVVATLSYGKNTLTQQFSVTVNTSITAFELAPEATTVDRYSVAVSGSVDFGFTSADSALFSIKVNGKEVYAENIDVTAALHKDLAVDIPLSKSGVNSVVASVTYGRNTLTKKFEVVVDSAIKSFNVTAASSAVSEKKVALSGSIDFGHVADMPAVLTVTANGTEVYSEDITVAADSLTHALAFDIALPAEGKNVIVATLRYDGQTATQQMEVTVNRAITDFTLAPLSTTVNDFEADLSGDITFGYTGTQPALLSIKANGKEVYAENIDVSTSLTYHFAHTIPLVSEGDNVIVATLSYGSIVLSRQFTVTIEPAIKTFTLSPAAASVTDYSVTMTGSADFGYHSAVPAVLKISVNGKVMHKEDIAVDSALNPSLNVTLPLDVEGENVIVSSLSYGSVVRTQRSTVTIDLTAPTIAFSSWTSTFASGKMTVTGTATLTTDYTVKKVWMSVDNGEFIPQTLTDNGDGTLSIDLETENPDIGVSTVTVKALVVVNGREKQYLFHTVFSVDPVFDCTSASSMSPTSQLIQENYWETRSMLGYFGKPDGGHNIAFVIDGNGTSGGGGGSTHHYTVEGRNLTIGTTAIETEFNVNRFTCTGSPCTVNYKLSVYVDGTQLCSHNNFGVVRNYN